MRKNAVAAVLASLLFALGAFAQVPEALFGGMRYRPIGPFRGGRALAVSGVRGQPLTFYFGAVAGGVFRSDDAGQTWTPLFDAEDNLSIGAIAVTESDPNVIYVGTGEACIRGNVTYGKGVYRSDDAGHTWRHVGLADARQMAESIVVQIATLKQMAVGQLRSEIRAPRESGVQAGARPNRAAVYEQIPSWGLLRRAGWNCASNTASELR